jgi:hypothetical protein
MLAKRWTLGVLMVLVGSIILTACEAESVEVTRVVTEKESRPLSKKKRSWKKRWSSSRRHWRGR